MFFVSDEIKEPTGRTKIGITDSYDSVQEYYTNSEIVSFVEEKKINIYGVSIFNHKATCNIMNTGVTLKKSVLRELLDNWKKVHNPWNGVPVEDYLASAKVGTVVTIDYSYTGDGDGRRHSGLTKTTKIDTDLWEYEDTENCFSGEVGNSRRAAANLEVAYIYSRPTRIDVYNL